MLMKSTVVLATAAVAVTAEAPAKPAQVKMPKMPNTLKELKKLMKKKSKASAFKTTFGSKRRGLLPSCATDDENGNNQITCAETQPYIQQNVDQCWGTMTMVATGGFSFGSRDPVTGKDICDKGLCGSDTMLDLLKTDVGCKETDDVYKQWKAAVDAIGPDQFSNPCYDATKMYTKRYYTDAECTTKLADDQDFKDLSKTKDYDATAEGCNSMLFAGPWGNGGSAQFMKVLTDADGVKNLLMANVYQTADCTFAQAAIADITDPSTVTTYGDGTYVNSIQVPNGWAEMAKVGTCYHGGNFNFEYAVKGQKDGADCVDEDNSEYKDLELYFKYEDLAPAPVAAAAAADSSAMGTKGMTSVAAVLVAFAVAFFTR